jgi:hypothetical protein
MSKHGECQGLSITNDDIIHPWNVSAVCPVSSSYGCKLSLILTKQIIYFVPWYNPEGSKFVAENLSDTGDSCFERHRLKPALRPPILTEVSRGFHQFLQANAGRKL